MASLRCIDLRKRFGGTTALDGVSVEFSGPGIWALVGSNGAGKSTLLNVITGLMRPDVGSCFLDSRNITNFSTFRIARCGIARSFQRTRLFWDLSVSENLRAALPDGAGRRSATMSEWKSQHHTVSARVSEDYLLELTELAHLARNSARDLSYGQQKLLSLGCCVATGANTFFFDEPVAGLDKGYTKKILSLMKSLESTGQLVVFIEHDLEAVRQIAEMVVVMSQGRVLTQGPPEAVLDEPSVRKDLIG